MTQQSALVNEEECWQCWQHRKAHLSTKVRGVLMTQESALSTKSTWDVEVLQKNKKVNRTGVCLCTSDNYLCFNSGIYKALYYTGKYHQVNNSLETGTRCQCHTAMIKSEWDERQTEREEKQRHQLTSQVQDVVITLLQFNVSLLTNTHTFIVTQLNIQCIAPGKHTHTHLHCYTA